MTTVVINNFPDEIKVKNKITYQELLDIQEKIYWYDDIWKETNAILKKSSLEYDNKDVIDGWILYSKIMMS